MSTEHKTILPLLARTTAQSIDILNEAGRKYLHLTIDVTVDPALASITPTIRGKDPVSGKYYDLLVGAAIAATGTVILKIGPALTAAANLVANDFIPRSWNFEMAVADTDSITYSVSYQLSD